MSDSAHAFDTPLSDPDSPMLQGPSDDEVDALADLFLGPALGDAGTAPRPAHERVEPHAHPTLRLESAHAEHEPREAVNTGDEAEAAAVPAVIEGLVLGHLPVLGGAWVRQYAAQRASELDGPVGFIRLGPGAAAVELVGPHSLAVTPEGDGLDEAIRSAAPFVRAWLIRVDELTEPELGKLDGLDQLTLLSGADDPAVIASYRALKQFAGNNDGSVDGRAFRVVWMGCDADRAEAASRRLHRAADAFLEHEFDAESFVPRIGTVPVASVYRGEADLDAEDLLSLIRVVADAGVSEPIRYAPPRESDPTERPAAEPEPEPEPEPIRPPMRDTRQTPRVDTDHADPLDQQQTTQSGAAALLSGLEPLPVTPPSCPHVEVAFDDAGAVHLVARAGGKGEPIASLIAELTAAQAWAVSQQQLLKLAAPGIRRLDERHPPTLHLLAETPRDARPLLDSGVRIHALTPVVVAGQTHWGCTPLN